MEQLTRRSLFGAAAAGGLAVAAGPGQAIAAPNEPIRMGLLASITGPSSTGGTRVVAGAQIAVDIINQLGGIAGRPVELLVEDTESNPKAGMDAVHKLIDTQKVPVVLGENGSAVTLPTAIYSNSKGVVQVNIAATAMGLRKVGPYVFSMMPTDEFVAKALADFAMADSGQKDVGIVAVNDSFGASIAAEIKKAVEAGGGRVVSHVALEPKRSDYRAELRRLFSADPKVVISIAFFETARVLHQQAFELGFHDQMKGRWYAAYVNLAADGAIPETVEGIKGLVTKGADGALVTRFTERYRKKVGDEQASAPLYALLAYDAVWAVALAAALSPEYTAANIKLRLPTVLSLYRGLSNEDKSVDSDGVPTAQGFAKQVVRAGKVTNYTPA